jgi:hypothetical protein
MAPKASPKKAVKAGKVEKKVKDPNAPKVSGAPARPGSPRRAQCGAGISRDCQPTRPRPAPPPCVAVIRPFGRDHAARAARHDLAPRGSLARAHLRDPPLCTSPSPPPPPSLRPRTHPTLHSARSPPHVNQQRPKTGYFFFLDDVRGPTKAKNPGASIGELGKLMGAAWGKLSDAEKAKYNEKNAKDKVRYEKEMAAYKK